MGTRRTATLTGWLMVVTFVTSIPAYFIFCAPVLEDPTTITGAGPDPTTNVALGALLELVLIVANVGTAVVPYAVFRRYSEGSPSATSRHASSSARSSRSGSSASGRPRCWSGTTAERRAVSDSGHRTSSAWRFLSATAVDGYGHEARASRGAARPQSAGLRREEGRTEQ